MRIELRNVKHAKFASQETDCFEASVYINGVRSGTVRNSGQGGSNEYHPWELAKALNAHGKTLPKMVTTFPKPDDPSKFWELEYNADLLIGEAFTRWKQRELLTKYMRDRILFLSTSGEVMQTGRLTKEQIRRVMADPSLLRDARTILNSLSLDAALELFLAHNK